MGSFASTASFADEARGALKTVAHAGLRVLVGKICRSTPEGVTKFDHSHHCCWPPCKSNNPLIFNTGPHMHHGTLETVAFLPSSWCM